MADRYWVGGTANWDGTAGTKWAETSGGAGGQSVPTSADDVFFSTASSGTVTIAAGNTGAKSINCTGFTGTITGSAAIAVSGNITLSAGMTYTHSGTVSINLDSTLITSGKTFSPLTINGFGCTVTLGDSLISSGAIILTLGAFNAVTYNVTASSFSSTSTNLRTLDLGTGLWSLTGTGTVWDIATTNLNYNKNTANIILTNTTTTARTFSGGSLPYNRLTIGGTTGTSTLTITGNNYFADLASTKTVAHTIALGTTIQTFGKWSVTGTSGNVVSLTGTGTSHVLAGAATSGINFLSMGSIGFAATSPGEFYAGANSTGTAAAPVFRTAPPAARTLYWVGGTGNWSSTARWSLSSGGGGGQAIPTSLDDVIFNSASNATAYTATLDVVARCKSITMAGPASGNVTLAGTLNLNIHNQATFPATGLTRTLTGGIVLSGTGSGKVFTSNGISFNGVTVSGEGSSWSLGSALASSVTLNYGSFSTANYNITGELISTASISLLANGSISLGSSTITLAGFVRPINFGNATTIVNNIILANHLNFNAGTSSINCTFAASNNFSFDGNGKTFNNVALTHAGPSRSHTITGANTFNNLTLTVSATVGPHRLIFNSNQTINGTFACSGTSAIIRSFLSSNTIGTPITITVATMTANNCDFRDITVSGAASPISPTGAGNCGGNTNITFPAAKNVYWNLSGAQNWSATGWATTSTGTPAVDNFPLAQDTAVFTNAGSVTGTITINDAFNIGTLDMSDRSSAMTLATGTITPFIYGNWINGSGITLSGTGEITFAGRGTQQITSSGKTFTQSIVIEKIASSVMLMDAFRTNFNFTLTAGTLNLNGFTATLTQFSSSNSNSRSLRGPGNINISYAPTSGLMWNTATSTNFSATGNIVVNTTLAFMDSDGTITTGTLSQFSSISFVINGSTSQFAFTRISNGSCFKDLSIINNGQADPSIAAGNNITVFGNLSFSGPSFSSQLLCNINLASTSGTKTITTNGLTVRTPLIFNGVGGTWQLLDNLTMISTAVTTLTNGTVDLNGKVFNVGTRLTTATGTKNITFNGGTLLCPIASTTAFNNATPTGFTTTAGTGVGKISMSAATAKTFVGGGSTYNCTLENAGAGALTISGSNTFNDITNSVQPTTFTFTSGTTTTVNNFSVAGTIGNIVTINSTSATFTLSKSSGIVGVSSCTISNSTATGGATWRAFTGQNNVNGGNNNGWIFTGDVNIIFGNLVMSGGLTITYS